MMSPAKIAIAVFAGLISSCTGSSCRQDSQDHQENQGRQAGSALPPAAGAEEKPQVKSQAKSQEIPLEERKGIKGILSFISEGDGNREVYVIRPDGSEEKRLTNSPHADYNGPAAPDGSSLISIRVEGEEGPQSLRLLPLSGGEARPVGPKAGRIRFPSFSPDGHFVVYESDGGKVAPSHFADIYRVDSDGKNFKQLTNNPEGNFEPAISPKGDAIVFISSRDRVAELYRMRPDGSEQERLTHTNRDEWGARFSPDGTKLVFVSDREGADRIWMSSSAGGEAKRLTQRRPLASVVEEKPGFSPAGDRIVYGLRIPDQPSRVVVVELATRIETVLAAPPGKENAQMSDASFSPDGKYLALTLTQGRDQQVWIARANGTGLTQVSKRAGGNWNPLWIAAR